jgi:hypothetical protein
MRTTRKIYYPRRGKMARREVIEIQCDRCGRTETQEKSQAEKASVVELVIEFQTERHEYADLCMRCRKACEGYFKSLTKQTEKDAQESPAPVAEKKSGMFGLGGQK